ncbi:sulfatase [Marinoscillum sp. MHG1-6]|uniref:sulfatase family protein n=1 Tax=Marinoscillum sp. MHG1-6 TaxID=2959627 RepID=UPI0021571A2D|nr:sulfatase [Marinoscillum sp. MHG1-6]
MRLRCVFFSFLIGILSVELAAQQQPNILWLTCEDISPTLSMYGDATASTPNLDRLAAESLIFTQAFATVGVCGPSRSSIITGMYPISIGTQHMRAGKDIMGWGTREYSGESKAQDINGLPVPLYSAVLPSAVKCFTEYLRKQDYFCTNNPKTDYQFAAPLTSWDENGNDAHWKHREEGQPFFAVFNSSTTHESRIWYNAKKKLTVDPAEVPLPDYYPDTETVRRDVARNYSNIELMDAEIGERIRELEEAGLLDNTIIFFFSDHGGPLPRGKREHYVSGLRVPMMVRLPDQLQQEFREEMVSFVDLAPTILSLAGIEIPDHLQGRAFLGGQKTTGKPYIFGSGDRFDEFSDRIRSVITKDFVYVRNYHTELPAYKDVSYRKSIPMMNELLEMRAAGKLDENQEYWFRNTKTAEEFYVRATDPFNLNNEIRNPAYEEEITELRNVMDAWLAEVGDRSTIPETEMLNEMWPDGVQPVCPAPKVECKKGVVTCSTQLEGASLAYHLTSESVTPGTESGWQPYHQPIQLKEDQHMYVVNTRIGYRDSEIIKVK